MALFFWDYTLRDGFEFDCVRYLANQPEDILHFHNYNQLALCLSGSGVFQFQQGTYRYEAGDIIVIGHGDFHGATTDPGIEVEFLFVVFYPQFVARDPKNTFDYQYLLPFLPSATPLEKKLHHHTPFTQALAEALLDLEQENKLKRNGYHHIIAAKLRLICGELNAHYNFGAPTKTALECHRKLRPAIDYISIHYMEPITLEEVAKVIYLSPSRFRHLFTEIMHLNFQTYLVGLRLQLSQSLLCTSDDSIELIAHQSGFSNLSHFYKIFQQRVGLSPAQYRRNHMDSHF